MNCTILGAQFGDEGKGRVVDWLCSKKETRPSIVVRFSGGQQAGHHVVSDNGFNHVFSNFGCGSLQNISTYWGPTCTFDPVGFFKEREILKSKDLFPLIFIDGKCPVTTPYEKYKNETDARNIAHGTCGCGVGATWEREKQHHSILFEDLYFPYILGVKLSLLSNLYKYRMAEKELESFVDSCFKVLDIPNRINITHGFPPELRNKILYEGSQGLLLDKKHGFFPHVTRSHTDTTNIQDPGHIYLVTRAYQTRHGNGPMSNINLKHSIKENPYEQNTTNSFQGKFRRSILDLSLLKYALMKDIRILAADKKTLVITCLDLLNEYKYTEFGKIHSFKTEHEFIESIRIEFGFESVLLSRSATGDLETFC